MIGGLHSIPESLAQKVDKLYPLPKWPGMVVTGSPITVEQAGDVILRTHPWERSHSPTWDKKVWDLVGLKYTEKAPYNLRLDYDDVDRFSEEFGILPLQYLHNERIASNWIGGIHGWCNWDGEIGSSNYNIGKWPSAAEVLSDWTMIAQAFPFLTLTCQLLSGEVDEENTHPVVEYLVKDGQVAAQDPTTTLIRAESEATPLMTRIAHRQTSCTLEQLKTAIALLGSRCM